MASQAPYYTVLIQGAATAHTFVQSPRLSWREVERKHRLNEHPAVLAYFVVELTLDDCMIQGGADQSPTGVVTALDAFLTDQGPHVRVVPVRVQIRDAANAVLAEVGDIDHANGWEEIQITRFDVPMDGAPEQLVGVARFRLVITAKRVFADTDATVVLDQQRFVGSGPDGLRVRRLTSQVEMTAGTAVSTVFASCRELLPVGWHRTIGNNSDGVDVTYTRHPLTTHATVVSEVRELGGAITSPAGSISGEADVTVEVDDDLRLGLQRTTTRASVTGGSDPLGYVEAQKPDGSTGGTTHNEGRGTADGSWQVIAVRNPVEGGSKLAKTRRRFTLAGGHAPVDVLLMARGAHQVREGRPRPWRLAEDVEVIAIGVTELADIPLPKALGAPWVQDGEPRVEVPPLVLEPGASTSQHLWMTTVHREYVWTGPGDPRKDRVLTEILLASETL